MRNTCLLTAKAIETATNGNLRKTSGSFRNPGQVLAQTTFDIIPVGDLVSPVDEVGGSVHGVDDPGRLVRQDARLPVGDRLLPDEAAAKKREKFTPEKQRRRDASPPPARAPPHQCVPSPNSFFRDPMMILSTLSSVLVTRSTAELLVWTLISLSPAFRTS